MSNVTELKPCPFCHCADTAVDDSAAGHLGILQIICTKCGAMGPYIDATEKDAEATARRLWNTRAMQSKATPSVDVEKLIEERIDRMGWPEIHAFQDTLRGGQDVYEDAGGFMVRAIKSLFGIKRDPVLTYREAARAAIKAIGIGGE